MPRPASPLPAPHDPEGLQTILDTAGQRRVFSLRGFGDPLEAHYQQYRAQQALPLQRMAAVLALLIYVSTLITDALDLLDLDTPWVRAPILWVALPACVLYFAYTFADRWQHYRFGAATLSCLVHAAVVAYISAQCAVHQRFFMPEAPVVQQLWCVLLMGLPLPRALFTAVSAALLFTAIHLGMGVSPSLVTQRVFMIIAGALVGLLATTLHEREQRLSWVRALQLRRMAERDSLTGLYNHRVFYERGQLLLRQCQREHRPMAVLLIDIDHFKAYNDDFGHLAGDQCLRQVAAALDGVAHRPMDVAARTGGEEFALLLYDIQPSAAQQRAEQLRQDISALLMPDTRGVTVSIGIARADLEARETIEALVSRADARLYDAKRAGRDRVGG